MNILTPSGLTAPDGHHLINGEWLAGDGEVLQSLDPGTSQLLWQGQSASASQVLTAVSAAQAAFKSWRKTSLDERVQLLKNYAAMLQTHAEVLATAIAREIGKPLWEARTEVASMINKIDISIQAASARTPSTLPDNFASPDFAGNTLVHRPHGVMAVLGPYNFPGHLPNGHIVPALLAGNTIVFKPSEHAPLFALMMARCWQLAGLPDGVLNVVNGAGATGAALAAADIDGLLFTGSYGTGLKLSQQFASQPEKILALEMGGNNPMIVWETPQDTAQQKQVILNILHSAFLSAGQRCTCTRRLIVPDTPAGQALIEQLVAATRNIRSGLWSDDTEPFMGPVVSAAIASQLMQKQEQLLGQGAYPLLPMQHLQPDTGLLAPGILDVTGVEGLPDEELFGPLLQIIRVTDFDSAIETANNTRYGLAATLISEDEALWTRFWQEIRAGLINWNRPSVGAASTAPFGGVGYSGNHRPSAWYAADYCAYPVASMISRHITAPATVPGLQI